MSQHGASMADAYAELRPLMFGIAYRMLGSVSDAEDIVQEAFLRYHRALAAGSEIRSVKAFLSAVTTRLAIDELRSARARREHYPGPWLPEPLLTDTAAADPADAAADADSLSMAFLLLLERLSPVERAVFLLREVFGYGYPEIAEIAGKTEDNCRQLALRARRHLAAGRPRFEVSRRHREELASRFFQALGDGDIDSLVELLAADVVVYGDGGGMGPSWLRPVSGREAVTRLLRGVSRDLRQLPARIESTEVNGQPGAVIRDPDGGLINVFCLDIGGGVVNTIRSIINPGKLTHLGPLADIAALQRRRSEAREHGDGQPFR